MKCLDPVLPFCERAIMKNFSAMEILSSCIYEMCENLGMIINKGMRMKFLNCKK